MKNTDRNASVPFWQTGCFDYLKYLFLLALAAAAAKIAAGALHLTGLLPAAVIPPVFIVCFFCLRFLEKKLKNVLLPFYQIFLTFLCTFSLQFFVDPSKSVIWVLLLTAVYLILRRCLDRATPRPVRVFATVLGSFFALFIFLGYQLKAFGALTVFGNTQGALLLMIFFPGLAVFFTLLLNVLLDLLEDKSFCCETPGRMFSGKAAFFRLMGIMLLCWLPYFIAFYPGVVTDDTSDELFICIGEAPLSNHHPVIHQLTLRVFTTLIPSLRTAVGAATAAQMICLAAVFSACLLYMAKCRMARGILWGSFAFFSLYTVNAFFSVTLWKDVWFGMAALLLALLLQRDGEGPAPQGRRAVGRVLLLSLAAFLFCTFRNNGWYAFLLAFPFCILIRRKDRKRLGSVFLLTVVLVLGYQYLLFNVFNAERSSSEEMLSIPLQQVARVVVLRGYDPADEDLAVLSELFSDIREIPERYRPVLSDNIKFPPFFKSEVFDADSSRYLKAWASLGLRYPVEYLEAFLFQNYGYWYPDETYWTAAYYSNVKDLPLLQDMRLLSFRVALFKLHVFLSESSPLGILTSPGFLFWLLLLAGALLILKKQGRTAAPMLLLFAVWGTTLASPVFCEYRYIYALVTCLPLYTGLALSKKKAE